MLTRMNGRRTHDRSTSRGRRGASLDRHPAGRHAEELRSLAEVVRTFLGQDPLSGSLFVFRNRSSQRVKILWWDQRGLAIYYKRLERGVFRFPSAQDQAVAIDSAQLLRLLDGLEIVARRAG